MAEVGNRSPTSSTTTTQYLPLNRTASQLPGDRGAEDENDESKVKLADEGAEGEIQEELCLADRPAFHSFIGVVIVFNAAIIGLETDYEWGGWFWLDQVMLAIYTTELAIRFHRHRLHFFSWHNHEQIWNILDLVIIVSGLIEAWLQPILYFVGHLFVGSGGHSDEHKARVHHVRQIVMLARMMRILKILRFLKLVKFLEPLYLLVTGVLAAVESVFWVLVLTFMVLYAMGIMVTRMVGHGLMFGPMGEDHDGEPPGVRQYFETVPISTFTLFRMMSGMSSDPEITAFDEIMSAAPSFKVAFTIFVVACSWTLLSILTAVVSENMIHNTEEHDEELEIVNEGENRKKRIAELTDLLQPCALASCHDGRVTSAGLEVFLSHKENTQNIAHVCGVPIRDILDVFEALELTSTCEGVSMPEFIESLVDVGRTVTQKSVLSIEARLAEIKTQILNKELTLAETVTSMILNELSKQEKSRDKSIKSLHDNIEKLEQAFARLGDVNGEHHQIVTGAVSDALSATLDKLRSDLSVSNVHEALEAGLRENFEVIAKHAARCEAIANRVEESASGTPPQSAPMSRRPQPQPQPRLPVTPQESTLPLRMVGCGSLAGASVAKAGAPPWSSRATSLSPPPTIGNWLSAANGGFSRSQCTRELATPSVMVPVGSAAGPPLNAVSAADDAGAPVWRRSAAGESMTHADWCRVSHQMSSSSTRPPSPLAPAAAVAGKSQAVRLAERRLHALRQFSRGLPLPSRETSRASNGSEDVLTAEERERQAALRHRDFTERERNAEMRHSMPMWSEQLNAEIRASELWTTESQAQENWSARSFRPASGRFGSNAA